MECHVRVLFHVAWLEQQLGQVGKCSIFVCSITFEEYKQICPYYLDFFSRSAIRMLFDYFAKYNVHV